MNIQSKTGITQFSGYEQTSSGTVHSVTDAERTAFTNFINKNLKDDPDCKEFLPIDPNSNGLVDSIKTGILLCKLVNIAAPNTIDERAINKTKLNEFKYMENLDLGINSASSIGCNTVNVDPEGIKQGRIHLILGLLWQIIRIALFQSINIKVTSDLLCMLREGETAEELLSLSPEQLLMRWVNYQVEKAGCTKPVNNFGNDLKDSYVYSCLESVIMPEHLIHHPSQMNSQSDIKSRAQMVIANAENAGVAALVSPSDIVSGNQKLNMLFLAEMFNKYPCLQTVEVQLDIEESREEKSYRNWMNSLGVKPTVTYFYRDLSDGIVLLQINEILYQNCVVWDKVNKPPFKQNKVFLCKVENCNKVVDLAKKYNFSVVGLSGEDIAKSSRLHILGLVWQLMSRYTLQRLQQLSGGDKPIADAEIIAWANEKYKSAGKTMKISSFKDPLVLNSHALFELLDILRVGSVDRSLVKVGANEEEKLLNAKLAVSLARKIGATVYALPEDIVEGKTKMVMTVFACLMITEFKKK
uniref:Plastin-2 (Trinotate prediction) n=1 Tax=Henneguya salminicola TaxID=69463 RepID=A0A6G3MED2_HENSL